MSFYDKYFFSVLGTGITLHIAGWISYFGFHKTFFGETYQTCVQVGWISALAVFFLYNELKRKA